MCRAPFYVYFKVWKSLVMTDAELTNVSYLSRPIGGLRWLDEKKKVPIISQQENWSLIIIIQSMQVC